MRTAAICPTCATYENALCVLYNGEYLPTIDVQPLDSLQTALEKIDVAVGMSGSSGTSGISGSSGTSGGSGSLESITYTYSGSAPELIFLSIPAQKFSFYGVDIDPGIVWSDFNFNYNLYNYLVGTTALSFTNLESLRSIYNISFTSNDMVILEFPVLKNILGYFFVNGNNLTTIDLGNLVFCDSCSISNTNYLTDVSLPSLEYGRTLQINYNNTLATIDISGIKILSGGNQLQFYGNPLLTDITLPTGLQKLGVNFDARNNALTQTSIDNILIMLANLDGTGGTTSYDNKTVNLTGGTNATPSATGLAAKATLVGRGCTVNNN